MFNKSNYIMEIAGVVNGFFRRNIMIKRNDTEALKLVPNFISKCKNTDVYRCIYEYSLQDVDSAKLYGPIYFDLDGDVSSNKQFQKLKQDLIGIINYFESELGLKEEEMNIFFSGSKGFHFTVNPEILGIIPTTDLNVLYKAWALYLYNTYNIKSIDLKIYDKRRLFRVPYTINSKTGLYKVILSKKDILELTLKNLERFKEPVNKDIFMARIKVETDINLEAAKRFYRKSQNLYRKRDSAGELETVKNPVKIPETKQDLLPCVKALLSEGAEKGYRNNTLVLISSAVLQSGYKLEETLDLMHEWNELNDPPLKRDEVEMTVRSAYTMLLSGKKYGCASIREMGYCVDNNCKLMEKGKN